MLTNEAGSVPFEGWNYTLAPSHWENLGGPCLSCLGWDRLVRGIERLVRRVRPESLVVEASGLTAVPDLLQRLSSEALSDLVEVTAVIGVLDALDSRPEGDAEVESALAWSSLIFVSKTDLLPTEKVQRLMTALAGGPTRRWVMHDPERIPWEDLLGGHHRPTARPSTQPGSDHHHPWDWWEYVQERPLDPQALGTFLKRPYPGLRRLKGQLLLHHPSARHTRYILNHAYPLTLLGAADWPPFAPRQTRLLVIGTGLPDRGLFAELDRLAR